MAQLVNKGSFQVQANFFKVGLIDLSTSIHMYRVDFGEFIMKPRERSGIMKLIRGELERIYGLHIGYSTEIFSLSEIR